MCNVCGCGIKDHQIDTHKNHHSHGDDSRLVQIEQDILKKNNSYAKANRRYFTERGIFVVNLLSSPGSGKTTLLIKTIEQLKDKFPIAIIEGDQQTDLDAERIRATGVPVIQINTGSGCHLDAHLVGHALEQLNLADESLLIIENVGNLICPAGFDLGEQQRIVILSVTEGEDKPLKYPYAFQNAQIMLLNKIDLLPYLNFNVTQCCEYAHRINPHLEIIHISAVNNTGLDLWCECLIRGINQARIQYQNNIQALHRKIAELEARLAQPII